MKQVILKEKDFYLECQKKYEDKITVIKERVAKGKKIRTAFFVSSLASFSSSLYDFFKKDTLFNVKIVIEPTTYNLNRIQSEFQCAQKLYGMENVIFPVNRQGQCKSLDNSFDLVFLGTAYDEIAVPCYRIEHFAKLGILTVYVPYGYLVSNHKLEFWNKGHEVSCLWRYYMDSQATYEECVKSSIIKGCNARFLGYPKMDGFSDALISLKGKKRVIIAAHHSMHDIKDTVGIQFSCFLRYYDFFIRLAKVYPEIEFVFRPHPLWEQTLRSFWPQVMIDEYYRKIEDLPNMFLHTAPDYFDLFLSSHAMINDCGSYLAEYMFTGKPLCFLSKGEVRDKENYNEHFAQKCIAHHYKAISELDIFAFLEEVVLKGNDFMKEERMAFFEKEIRGNWPHSSEKIYQDIKNSILG